MGRFDFWLPEASRGRYFQQENFLSFKATEKRRLRAGGGKTSLAWRICYQAALGLIDIPAGLGLEAPRCCCCLCRRDLGDARQRAPSPHVNFIKDAPKASPSQPGGQPKPGCILSCRARAAVPVASWRGSHPQPYPSLHPLILCFSPWGQLHSPHTGSKTQ